MAPKEIPGNKGGGDRPISSQAGEKGGQRDLFQRSGAHEQRRNNPLEHIHPPADRLQMYEQQATQVFGDYARKHEMTLEQYNQALDQKARDLVSDARPWMRVSEGAMVQILAEGRLKSGFESGTLSGFKEHARQLTEQSLFGYPRNLDHSERPLYGYPSNTANGDSYVREKPGTVDAYGPVAIRFKDEVAQRATVTFGDSLLAGTAPGQLDIVPTPLENPDGRSFVTYRAQERVPDPLDKKDYNATMRYAELQYHGGLTTSDIEEVVFHGDHPGQQVQKELRAAHIPYRHVK